MAIEQKKFAFGTVSGTGLTSIYTVPTQKTIRPFLVITNTATSLVEAEVSIDDGTNRVLAVQKIASGEGKNWRVLEMADLRLEAGDQVNLRLISGGPANYFLSGVQYDVA